MKRNSADFASSENLLPATVAVRSAGVGPNDSDGMKSV